MGDINFNILFGSKANSLTAVDTTLKFRHNNKLQAGTRKTRQTSAAVEPKYIIAKQCVDMPDKRIFLSNKSQMTGQLLPPGLRQLNYLGETCEEDTMSTWDDCYGKYVTLIFYLPGSFEYV